MPGLDALVEFGLAPVAIAALAGFAWWVLRRWAADRDNERDDLRRQRDAATAGWQGQLAATEKLVAALRELDRRLDRQLDRHT